MAKQYHFVVSYNTELHEWCVEPDVSVNFDSGDVWDNDIEDWSFNTCDTAEEIAITSAISRIMREAEPVYWEEED